MKKIKIFLLSLASSFGAMAADIDVTPGQLEGLLPNGGKGETELKLTGKIDARDLAVFENLSPDVHTVDLGGVSIEALTMPTRKYFGRTLFNEGDLPPYTFFKSAINTLVLPFNITTISEGTFAGSDITELVIPEGVTSIGDYAFYGCRNLEKVTLPSTLRSIGKGAFANCVALKEVANLSATGLTEIPDRAFAGSVVLESLGLPQGVNRIGREAFSHTMLKSLHLGNVMEFEAYALSSMPYLEELEINPDAEIKEGLLMDDISLGSLTGMPEFVPDYFAANCSNFETSAINDVASLGRYSFANTLAPEELVVSGFIQSVGRGAFSGLNNLVKINVTALESKVPATEEGSFEGIDPSAIELWVDHSFHDLWAADPEWGRFNIKSEDTTGVDGIKDVEVGIDISLGRGFLLIESGVPVSDIRIYTADGRMAYVASPGRERVEIDTASLPSGIVVVAASDEDGNSKTTSILLR